MASLILLDISFPPKQAIAVLHMYVSFVHQNNADRLLDMVLKIKTQLRNSVFTSMQQFLINSGNTGH